MKCTIPKIPGALMCVYVYYAHLFTFAKYYNNLPKIRADCSWHIELSVATFLVHKNIFTEEFFCSSRSTTKNGAKCESE